MEHETHEGDDEDVGDEEGREVEQKLEDPDGAAMLDEMQQFCSEHGDCKEGEEEGSRRTQRGEVHGGWDRPMPQRRRTARARKEIRDQRSRRRKTERIKRQKGQTEKGEEDREE